MRKREGQIYIVIIWFMAFTSCHKSHTVHMPLLEKKEKRKAKMKKGRTQESRKYRKGNAARDGG